MIRIRIIGFGIFIKLLKNLSMLIYILNNIKYTELAFRRASNKFSLVYESLFSVLVSSSERRAIFSLRNFTYFFFLYLDFIPARRFLYHFYDVFVSAYCDLRVFPPYVKVSFWYPLFLTEPWEASIELKLNSSSETNYFMP